MSPGGQRLPLTGLRRELGEAGTHSPRMPGKSVGEILGEPEPCRDLDRPIRRREVFFRPHLKR